MHKPLAALKEKSNHTGQNKNSSTRTIRFVDNRNQARTQREFQGMVSNNLQFKNAVQLKAIVQKASNASIQLKGHGSNCSCGHCNAAWNQSLAAKTIQKKEVVVQRTFAPGSPQVSGFENKVDGRRIKDMTKSLKKSGSASLMGNYAMDYSDNSIYESVSGSHAEQQIADDWDSYYDDNQDDTERVNEIKIYTERAPCAPTCNPMMAADPHFQWTVNYTTPTGAAGRQAIYDNVKSDIAQNTHVSVKNLIVDDNFTAVNIASGTVKKYKDKGKSSGKDSAKHDDFEYDEEEDYQELYNDY